MESDYFSKFVFGSRLLGYEELGEGPGRANAWKYHRNYRYVVFSSLFQYLWIIVGDVSPEQEDHGIGKENS